jgi:anthranilate phosphoribosyltransferase
MEILNKLVQNQNLSVAESQTLLTDMIGGKLTEIQIAATLTALKTKGESKEELLGFIKTMRSAMIHMQVDDAIDVCGTGGDKKNTFNISTAVALVVASAGVKVAKHGNRAVSSKSGSADVLETLNIKIDLDPEISSKILDQTGFAFLFAPLYHPSMKKVAYIRRELQMPTIFNLLGPFANPAQVKRQLIGITNKESFLKLAKVATELKYEHLILVSSQDGMDEVSIFAPTNVIEIKNKKVSQYIFNPEEYGLKYKSEEKIIGGTNVQNAQIILNIFNGETGVNRDIVVVNSAFALLVAGKVDTLESGLNLARETINYGKPKKLIAMLQKETNKYA